MGRAGIEPATLGLKVRPRELQALARSCNRLQIGPTMVAANRSERSRVETSVYACFTRRFLSNMTTRPVVRLVHESFARLDLTPLPAVLPKLGYVTGFLTPPPRTGRPSISV
jgi:hypothetical protein